MQVLPLSAQSDESLAALVAHYRDWLNRDAGRRWPSSAIRRRPVAPGCGCVLALVARARDQLCDKFQLLTLKEWSARDQLQGSLIFAADTRDEAACRQLAAERAGASAEWLVRRRAVELAQAIDSPAVREALAGAREAPAQRSALGSALGARSRSSWRRPGPWPT